MMQVMMFAVGLYAMDFQGIDRDMQHFLRLVSFLVTTPVVFYSARPFFASAWRGVVGAHARHGPAGVDRDRRSLRGVGVRDAHERRSRLVRLGDDVRVLPDARPLPRDARAASFRSIADAALSTLLPNTATRLDGTPHTVVPVSQLKTGDRLLVRAGDPIPADGLLASAIQRRRSAADGRGPRPQAKSRRRAGRGQRQSRRHDRDDGDPTGSDTTLGTISRMSERARYARPALVTLADKVASYIVVALLIVATGVATFWYFNDPDRAFVITLSVLVVTCPCALALATPAAFAAAGSRLSQLKPARDERQCHRIDCRVRRSRCSTRPAR